MLVHVMPVVGMRGTHDSDSIVVNVCLLVEFLLWSVLDKALTAVETV